MVRYSIKSRRQRPTPKTPNSQRWELRSCGLGVACLVAFAALGIQGAAQQQPQTQTPQATFRATQRLIVQSVFVKDKDGKPIEGLTAKDFIITEDGLPQDIAFVEYQRLATDAPAQVADPQAPVPLTARPAAPPTTAAPTVQTGISSPPSGDIRYQDKRLLVLYFVLSVCGSAIGEVVAAQKRWRADQLRSAMPSILPGSKRQPAPDGKEAL